MFIKTYFKNSNEEVEDDKYKIIATNENLQKSSPIDELYQQKLMEDDVRRNSKSNTHLRFKKKIITDKFTKLQNYGEEAKMDKDKVESFISSFSNQIDFKRRTFTAFRGNRSRPEPDSNTKNWDIYDKRRTINPNNPAVSQIAISKIDTNIIEMMQKLGYNVKDIYSGLVMGNEHLTNVYAKLLNEKQDAIDFMKSFHK